MDPKTEHLVDRLRLANRHVHHLVAEPRVLVRHFDVVLKREHEHEAFLVASLLRLKPELDVFSIHELRVPLGHL